MIERIGDTGRRRDFEALTGDRRVNDLAVWRAPDVGDAQLQPVLAQRCVMCHGEALQSKGVRLDSPAELKRHAQAVYQQVVVTKQMPMNNATGLTDEERALFARWFEGGARVD